MTTTKNNLRRLLVFLMILTVALPNVVFAAEVEYDRHSGSDIFDDSWSSWHDLGDGNWEFDWSLFPEIESYYHGILEPYQPDECVQSRLESLLPRIDQFDEFTAEEQAIVMSHLGNYGSETMEMSPEELERVLTHYEKLAGQDSRMREHIIFMRLLMDGRGFSDLTEDEHLLLFRQLDITYKALEVMGMLLAIMERDGFTLSESVDILRIMSTGLFNYIEAQTILESTYSILRVMEIARFERFAQMFDIESQVNDVRLINRTFKPTNEFSDNEEVEDKYENENKKTRISMKTMGPLKMWRGL